MPDTSLDKKINSLTPHEYAYPIVTLIPFTNEKTEPWRDSVTCPWA